MKGLQISKNTKLQLFEKVQELEEKSNMTTYDNRNYFEQSEGAYAILKILGINIEYINWSQEQYEKSRAGVC